MSTENYVQTRVICRMKNGTTHAVIEAGERHEDNIAKALDTARRTWGEVDTYEVQNLSWRADA